MVIGNILTNCATMWSTCYSVAERKRSVRAGKPLEKSFWSLYTHTTQSWTAGDDGVEDNACFD